MNRMSTIEGARDVMLPKKLILNPPKNPPQQPTQRIKFTNVNKDVAQPAINVDEEARKRQDEQVRAASRGLPLRSTESPVCMAQRGTASRESSKLGNAPGANVATGSKRSASVASTGAIDDNAKMPQDSTTKDAIPETKEPAPLSEDQDVVQDTTSSVSTMQPPAVVPQPAQPVPAARAPPATPAHLFTTAFDRVTRDPAKGKASPHINPPSLPKQLTLTPGLEHALYTLIEVETDPELHHPYPWKMTIHPSPTLTQQGMIFHLGPSHTWLLITLHLSDTFLVRAQTRHVVSRELIEIPSAPPFSPRAHRFHIQIIPGVNTICVDVMASISARGEPAFEWPAERFDFERCILTVNVLAQEMA
jgi:hypothetical protein